MLLDIRLLVIKTKRENNKMNNKMNLERNFPKNLLSLTFI